MLWVSYVANLPSGSKISRRMVSIMPTNKSVVEDVGVDNASFFYTVLCMHHCSGKAIVKSINTIDVFCAERSNLYTKTIDLVE